MRPLKPKLPIVEKYGTPAEINNASRASLVGIANIKDLKTVTFLYDSFKDAFLQRYWCK